MVSPEPISSRVTVPLLKSNSKSFEPFLHSFQISTSCHFMIWELGVRRKIIVSPSEILSVPATNDPDHYTIPYRQPMLSRHHRNSANHHQKGIIPVVPFSAFCYTYMLSKRPHGIVQIDPGPIPTFTASAPNFPSCLEAASPGSNITYNNINAQAFLSGLSSVSQ